MPGTAKAKETDANLFSKEQLLSSTRFSSRRDLMEAVLEDGKWYSIEDVGKLIEKYEKKEVK